MEKVDEIIDEMIKDGEFKGSISADMKLKAHLSDDKFRYFAGVIVKSLFQGFFKGLSDSVDFIAYSSTDVDIKDSLNYLLDICLDHVYDFYMYDEIKNPSSYNEEQVNVIYKEVNPRK